MGRVHTVTFPSFVIEHLFGSNSLVFDVSTTLMRDNLGRTQGRRSVQVRLECFTQQPGFVVIVCQQLIEESAQKQSCDAQCTKRRIMRRCDDQIITKFIERMVAATLCLKGFVPNRDAGQCNRGHTPMVEPTSKFEVIAAKKERQRQTDAVENPHGECQKPPTVVLH